MRYFRLVATALKFGMAEGFLGFTGLIGPVWAVIWLQRDMYVEACSYHIGQRSVSPARSPHQMQATHSTLQLTSPIQLGKAY